MGRSAGDGRASSGIEKILMMGLKGEGEGKGMSMHANGGDSV
jgi:hypothetical protein